MKCSLITVAWLRPLNWSSGFLFNSFVQNESYGAHLLHGCHDNGCADSLSEDITYWSQNGKLQQCFSAQSNKSLQLPEQRREMKIYALLSSTQLLPHMRNIVIWNIPLTAGSQSFCGVLNIFMIRPHDANLRFLPSSVSCVEQRWGWSAWTVPSEEEQERRQEWHSRGLLLRKERR